LHNGKISSFCTDPVEFRERVRGKGYIKKHPFKNSNGEYRGIPQGTPISAFLSNLYMLDFDKKMYEEIELKRGGVYRRYSDDIIVLCDPQNAIGLQDEILKWLLEENHLIINKDKVSVSRFERSNGRLNCDKPLDYLGFSFDGENIRIKDASLAKYYRKMKKVVRANARIVYYNKKQARLKGKVPLHGKLRKHDIYKGFSHLGVHGKKRNFYLYAQEASRIMNEPAINGQMSKAWKNLNAEISKNISKYNL